jgi:hypothetical protein
VLYPVAEDSREPGSEECLRRALCVIIGANDFICPCPRIDKPETELRVSIWGLADAADSKRTPQLDFRRKCLDIFPNNYWERPRTEEEDWLREMRKLMFRNLDGEDSVVPRGEPLQAWLLNLTALSKWTLTPRRIPLSP